MKKHFLIAICLGLFVAFSVNAQNSDLTWQELKKQQTEERVAMIEMQKMTLQNLIETQKAEMQNFKGVLTGDSLDKFLEKLRVERNELAKAFSEERTKLAQTHAEERKVYLAKK